VGTFPFNPSEAIILGTLLGAAIAQTGIALRPHLDKRPAPSGQW
jgi:hypothetical protein